MPDTKISSMSEMVGSAFIIADDLLEVVDVSSSSNMKMKFATLMARFTGEIPYTPPSTSSLSVTRTGSTGVISNLSYGRGIRLSATGTSANSNDLVYAMTSISSGAGGWNAIARLRRHSPLLNWGVTGLIIRDSGSSKSEILWLGTDSVLGLNRTQMSNDTTWNSVTAVAGSFYDLDFWLKVEEISGSRKWYTSKDGDFWAHVLTQTISTAYVNSASHVGIVLNANYGGPSGGPLQNVTDAFDCLSWQQNAL